MNKTKIAIVGLNFGRHILEGELLKGPGAEFFAVAAVCDADGQKAAMYGKKHGIPHYADLDALLENKDVEAVGLYTGPAGRAALIGKIIRSGRDVMTTKPFELDAGKAAGVLAEARRLGRAVHMNSPSPLPTEDLRIIAGWREKYGLGRPIACQASSWANYRDAADGSWYDDPELCPAAPVYRLGIYLINDLVWLLGEPESVTVQQSRIFTGRPTSDNAQMGILFKSGAIANVFSSFCVNDGQHYRNALVLNYENGTVYRNVGPLRRGEKNRLAVIAGAVAGAGTGAGAGNAGSNAGNSAGSGAAETTETIETAETDQHSGEYLWEDFHRAARGEDVLPGGAAEYDARIVCGVRIVEAMRRAQKTGGAACLE
ncbi:MAG: Gfo/Idh/MocA family oxidoreductase [Clostridiales bacterium]|nr:Gfo/Idh/MocA family oxidoreductase [Clostridiales bacterium]